jgi:excinuclease ABC subunit A
MNFLPDVYVQCETCRGKRYNREALEIRYRNVNIAEVLDMTVAEACELFKNVPTISNKLQTLNDVGLGYIRLGQPATTLSGGEAQRVKLATELSKRATGRTLYILDEPTTGLHFADVSRLLEVLNRLVETGNTVLVIEHNLDVIKTADWVIDLGPEGGDRGGEVIAVGTPEQIVDYPRSYTGQYLRRVLTDTASTSRNGRAKRNTKPRKVLAAAPA